MGNGRNFTIFRRGSKTYFYNSLFFPREVRGDVFALYAFVRKADDLVDGTPPDPEGFASYVRSFKRAWEGSSSSDPVVDGFVALARRRGFDRKWVDAFLASMRMDLIRRSYDTLADVEGYIYGSAEVVGLMMARIMGVEERGLPYARTLGKAMQYINFVRDIAEDNALGRTYLPMDRLTHYGLADLREDTARSNPDGFAALVREQIRVFLRWQRKAEQGFPMIPKPYRAPVIGASRMYAWTAQRIADDPFVVFRRKVKPSKARIVANVLRLALDPSSVRVGGGAHPCPDA